MRVAGSAAGAAVGVVDAEQRHHGHASHPFIDIDQWFNGLLEFERLSGGGGWQAQGAAHLDKAGIVIAGEIIQPPEAVAVLFAVRSEVGQIEFDHPSDAVGAEVFDAFRITGGERAIGEGFGGHPDAFHFEECAF